MVKKHPSLIYFISIFLILILLLELIHHQTYASIKTAKNDYQVTQQLNKQKHQPYHYLFIYKTGCPDCHKIRKQILPELQKNRTHLVAINSFNYQHHNLVTTLTEYHVTDVPTLIIFHYNHPIYSYSGNTPHNFSKILKHPYSYKSSNFTIVNDFTHQTKTYTLNN